MKKIIGIMVLLTLIVSCKFGISPEESKKVVEEVKKEKTSTEIIKENVNSWNNAIRNKNIEELEKIVGDKIDYYKASTTKENYLKGKKTYFDKHNTFGQEIKGDAVEIKDISDKQYKATFTKIVTTKDGTNEYPVTLVFEKVENEWKLVMEDSTDAEKVVKKPTNEAVAIKSRMDSLNKKIERKYEIGEYSNPMEGVGELYGAWDKELSRIYKMVMSQLSEDKKLELRNKQRKWLKDRDIAVEKEKYEFCGIAEGGSEEACGNGVLLETTAVMVEWTKEKTLELAKMYDNLNK